MWEMAGLLPSYRQGILAPAPTNSGDYQGFRRPSATNDYPTEFSPSRPVYYLDYKSVYQLDYTYVLNYIPL